MANRVEVGEIVENATGLNVTGASVTVRFHGGANAPVYNAENGGALLTQPLTTVNGKIGADYPSGAWVAEGDYDLDVVFGGDTLTFFWPARRATQVVTTLPAGVGTSAPEDGESAIELYDGANGAAWLRRYRAASSAWDMIGGPPPAGGALPGTARERQEFYLTGSTPAVQHLRHNGVSWDYVGTPPFVPVTGSPLNILDVGQFGQRRAGRQLALADFSTVASLPTTPVGLFNLSDLTNLGTGGALVNKGAVTFANGIEGQGSSAAQFTGSTGQAIYIADTGAADPFRIRTGSWGCWVKTAKRGTLQSALTKRLAATQWAFSLRAPNAINVAEAFISIDGTTTTAILGTTDIADDRWHHVVAVFDGTTGRLYVDGVLEATGTFLGGIFQSSAPLNIGGYGADGAAAAVEPHFGRVDEAFVTPDVLTEDQVRLLYAAKVPHGYATTPVRASVGVRRKRRGAALVSADFPSQPKRLHSFTAGALTDAGSDNQVLQANFTPISVTGADGSSGGSYSFVAASTQSLSATDAGLPAGTSARSFGAWFKTSTLANMHIMDWGTAKGTNDTRLEVGVNGVLFASNGADDISTVYVADGQWHHVVVTEENVPVDGVKRKLYLDGRLVGGSTVLNSITLGGANKFRIGASVTPDAFWTGQIDEAFVFAGVLTQEQIAVLYQKPSQALATSPKEEGAHVEAFDATNVYWIADTLDSHWAVDLAVAS